MKRSRKFIFPLFLLFLLFGGASLIFDLIYKYPVTYIFDKIVWSIPVRVLFVIVVCLLLIWKQFTWIKNAYIMSQNQKFAYGFAMLLFIFARYGDDWSFLKIDAGNEIVKWHWQPLIYDLKLIDILWLSLIYPLFAIFKKKRKLPNGTAFFEEDLPLKDSNKNELHTDEKIQEVKDPENKNSLNNEESQQYHELTKILVPKLVKQKFQKAFSIGIIGPYGNGKSSFVNHLRDKFKDQLKPQRFEIIEFLPAYSHKPEQISTDFFTILASRLKKYHGSLNQSLLTYAAKLIELGVNGKKDIQGLLKPMDWFTENKSASQAYLGLKEIFTQIDVKTIVIIDDVDRLGKDEIFEVLRIIRNTANFPNTIFLVAYDKDYVVKTIGEDLMYLDKYFQYEMFVPPHRSEDLLNSFSDLVLSKETGIDTEKLKKVINVETLNKTLLDRFVFNYRDVKVLTNVYRINLKLLTEDVDYIDLLYFTVMNKHFPKQVRYIYNNFGEIFESKKDHKMGIGVVDILKLKDNDSLGVPITVDGLIAELEIKNRSQRILFKRLFLLLFGIKDDTPMVKELSGASEKEKLEKLHKKLQNIPYSPDLELSIKNIERTHIYFELFLRKDDLSNVAFSLKLGTDKFQDYIQRLLKNLEGQQKWNFKEKIKNKLEYYNEKIDTKIKIENAITVAPLVGVDMTNILFYYVTNYEYLSKELFKDENDFATFFKEKLWENKDLTAEYIIQTILRLILHVKELEGSADRNIIVPPYIGLSKEKVKDFLIAKTIEFINDCSRVSLDFLVQLSKILDSDLYVSDGDIRFSDYLYANKDRLLEYLKIVEKFYVERSEFSSAIFKVFTDKDQFKEKCFELKEEQILIREFHHLLELHDIRKNAVNLSEFTPFYFSANKGHDANDQYQSIYLKKEPRLEKWNSLEVGVPNKRFVVCGGANSIDIIEGKLHYETLMSRFIPTAKQTDLAEFLNKNHDVKIISIQTPEEIHESLLPYIKYYQTLKDEAIISVV